MDITDVEFLCTSAALEACRKIKDAFHLYDYDKDESLEDCQRRHDAYQKITAVEDSYREQLDALADSAIDEVGSEHVEYESEYEDWDGNIHTSWHRMRY